MCEKYLRTTKQNMRLLQSSFYRLTVTELGESAKKLNVHGIGHRGHGKRRQ